MAGLGSMPPGQKARWGNPRSKAEQNNPRGLQVTDLIPLEWDSAFSYLNFATPNTLLLIKAVQAWLSFTTYLLRIPKVASLLKRLPAWIWHPQLSVMTLVTESIITNPGLWMEKQTWAGGKPSGQDQSEGRAAPRALSSLRLPPCAGPAHRRYVSSKSVIEVDPRPKWLRELPQCKGSKYKIFFITFNIVI